MNSTKQELETRIREVKREYGDLEHRMRGWHSDAYDDLRSKLRDLEQSIDRLAVC